MTEKDTDRQTDRQTETVLETRDCRCRDDKRTKSFSHIHL